MIMKESTYNRLRKYVCNTDFQYETGGILLGYRLLWRFYVVDFTFPRCLKNKRRMTFILNGEEHMKEMERIKNKYFVRPRLIGVWHSHTTEDSSLSMQDRGANKLLVRKFGGLLSVIVTQQGMKGIQLTSYYISRKGEMHLCKKNKCKNKL